MNSGGNYFYAIKNKLQIGTNIDHCNNNKAQGIICMISQYNEYMYDTCSYWK